MKTKKIFTAKLAADDELLSNLGPDRIGCMESWSLMSQGASFSIYLFVPDLSKTDTFSFDVLFEDRFLKNNDVKIGDHFPVTIPRPSMLRQIEITGISEGEPINNRENKRAVKQSQNIVSDFLNHYLYHTLEPDECLGEDGWFSVDALIKRFEKIGILTDQATIEDIVSKNKDHRYILSDDKTKIRISDDHPAPKYVEEQLKTVDGLKIKRSFFILNGLPTVKEKKLVIIVDCSDSRHFEFPFMTNKIFSMDEKHFFMLLQHRGDLMMAVSPYMMKDTKEQYRFFIKDMPAVINHYFRFGARLVDFEGKTFEISVKETT